MNIISFDTEININKRIINITRELSTVPKDILLTHFLGCVSQLIKQAKEKKSHRNALKQWKYPKCSDRKRNRLKS